MAATFANEMTRVRSDVVSKSVDVVAFGAAGLPKLEATATTCREYVAARVTGCVSGNAHG